MIKKYLLVLVAFFFILSLSYQTVQAYDPGAFSGIWDWCFYCSGNKDDGDYCGRGKDLDGDGSYEYPHSNDLYAITQKDYGGVFAVESNSGDNFY